MKQLSFHPSTQIVRKLRRLHVGDISMNVSFALYRGLSDLMLKSFGTNPSPCDANVLTLRSSVSRLQVRTLFTSRTAGLLVLHGTISVPTTYFADLKPTFPMFIFS